MSRADELDAAISRATEVGDLIELRLDCLNNAERDVALTNLSEWSAGAWRPMILTLRAAEQGGHNQLSYDDRRRFWSSLDSVAKDCLVDLELDLVRDRATEIDWSRVICSHHDVARVPPNLDQIYEQMAATRARFLKIAVQAGDATDCLSVFGLLERAQRNRRELIAIAMGPAGVMTRILGPSRGSCLTYGSLDDESTTAPGQITARDLRDVYRIDHIDRHTEIFGIVGTPVSHSLSPHIHNAAFAAADLNAVYIPFEVRDAVSFVRRMVHPRSREIDWNLRGLSVTAPHKFAVMPELDWIDAEAREIGAVNTIVVQDDRLSGYNTDAYGFIQPLRERFGSLAGARCAIIGAGGAAGSAVWALRRENADVMVFARDREKADAALKQLGVNSRSIDNASFEGFDVVVNATPLGTRGEQENETAASADQLRGVRWAYDLVYNPGETRFLREARAAGCETLSGMEMLIAQAVEQFKLWIGKQPDVSVMRAAGQVLATETRRHGE